MARQEQFDQKEIGGVLEFLHSAEQLKNTLRSAHTSEGRQESVAEHTWRLCLLAILLERNYPHINLVRLIKMLVIHDMGEIIGGDIPAIYQDPKQDKNEQERNDFLQLIAPLDDARQAEFLAIWDEYNEVKTEEAKLAKALDKLETLLQHVQGKNPENFDYGFNLSYGTQYTNLDPVIAHIRKNLDERTKSRMDSKTSQ